MLLNSKINAKVKFKEKELVGTFAAGCASVWVFFTIGLDAIFELYWKFDT